MPIFPAVKGLLEKDFVTQEDCEYFVYDHFFQLWLEKESTLRGLFWE
jgi:hypothetical protein